MQVTLSPSAPETIEADLLCVGLFEGDQLPSYLDGTPGIEDVESGKGKLTVLRPAEVEARRTVVVGLGSADDFDSERARVAAAGGVRQARRYEAETIVWVVPGDGSIACGLTSGTILAGYEFKRLKSDPGDGDPLEHLILCGVDDSDAEKVETARVASEAANRTRNLQNLPANIADPAYMAARAERIAQSHDSVSCEVFGPDKLRELGMGGLISVGDGSAKDPLLITLRYEGNPGGDDLTAFVGKGVTFDTGGISLKPSPGMENMKKDMSGGAAALEATNAIAELGLPINLITAVPVVENMPSGTATRPGDVITQMNGKTVEIDNTDAEGRLILADALTWCARQGADRIVDLATLTGAVIVALGSTHAAVISNDDDWADAVTEAGRITGELIWRLPMHQEYRDLMKGKVADLTNSSAKRKAGTITAGAYLENFVEDVTWAHIDIAGTAWDVGRPYLGSGASGYGTRLLVELARRLSQR